eukprot:14665229-Alexandrium_andersonii.AAC.1
MCIRDSACTHARTHARTLFARDCGASAGASKRVRTQPGDRAASTARNASEPAQPCDAQRAALRSRAHAKTTTTQHAQPNCATRAMTARTA